MGFNESNSGRIYIFQILAGISLFSFIPGGVNEIIVDSKLKASFLLSVNQIGLVKDWMSREITTTQSKR